MNHKTSAILLFLASIVLGCSKTETFNITSIVYRDNNNTPMGSSGDTSGQWVEQTFNPLEMSLFNGLNSESLEGTSTPTSVNQSAAYPNPFANSTIIGSRLNQEFQGAVVAKYVIVNRVFQPVVKGSVKIYGNNITFRFDPAIPKGYYRVYMTYSALGNEHFFKFWGNILKN